MSMKRTHIAAAAMAFAVAAVGIADPAMSAGPEGRPPSVSPESGSKPAPGDMGPPAAERMPLPGPDAAPPQAGQVQRELPPWARTTRPSEKRPGEARPAPRGGPGDRSADVDKPARPPGDEGAMAGAETAAKVPEPEDTPAQRRRSLDDLYAHLAAIGSEDEAAPLVLAIERLWLYSGSDTIDVLMERVLKAVGEQRLDLAEKLSEAIVGMAPRFAEAWNRRALVAYLRDDYAAALYALRRALALEPNHFKALDGIAHIMRETGEKKAALDAYRKLLDVHPQWSGAGEAVEELKREIEGQGI